MSLVRTLVQEVETESATTRQVLERVPADKLTWKPHRKSMSLGELALHVAAEPGLLAPAALAGSVDFAGHAPQAAPTTTGEILAAHDASLATVKRVLGELGDAGLERPCTMKMNGTPLRSLPNAAFVRTALLNHVYHHRGQLSVYLRLLDVPVPPIYGPSADENPFAAARA